MRRVSASKAVLLVVDVQGKLALKAHGSDELLRRVTMMIGGCAALKVPVAYTEQLPEKLGDTHPLVKTALEAADAKRFVKRTFSCVAKNDPEAEWNNSGLWASLDHWKKTEGRDQVLLCGIESHICVMQTAFDLVESGRQVFLVTDAASSQRVHDRDIAWRRMESEGVILSTTEMALFEMLQRADLTAGSDFRSVTKLLV